MSTNVMIDDSFANIDVTFNEDITLPPSNLFGGEELKQALQPYLYSSSSTSETRGGEKCVRIRANNLSGKVLFTGPFKNNTQYTILVRVESWNYGSYPPFRIRYTDGSYSYVGDNKANSGVKVDYRTITTEGKTIEAIIGYYDSSSYYVYYERCGIFEGVMDWEDFSLNEKVLFQIGSTPCRSNINIKNVYNGDIISAQVDGSVFLLRNNILSNIGTWKIPTTLSEEKIIIPATENTELLVKSYVGDIQKIAKNVRKRHIEINEIKNECDELDQNINNLSSQIITNISTDNNSISSSFISGHSLYLTSAGVDYYNYQYNNYIYVNGQAIKILKDDSAGRKSQNYFVKVSDYNDDKTENDTVIETLENENAQLQTKVNSLTSQLNNLTAQFNALVSQLNEFGIEIDVSDIESEPGNDPQSEQNITIDNDGIINLGGSLDNNDILITNLSIDENGYLYNNNNNNINSSDITIDNEGIITLGEGIDNDGNLITNSSIDNNSYLSNNNNNSSNQSNIIVDSNGMITLGNNIDNDGNFVTSLTLNDGILTG